MGEFDQDLVNIFMTSPKFATNVDIKGKFNSNKPSLANTSTIFDVERLSKTSLRSGSSMSGTKRT